MPEPDRPFKMQLLGTSEGAGAFRDFCVSMTFFIG
jgi:hypothetical protein